jgi:hypothetical protein
VCIRLASLGAKDFKSAVVDALLLVAKRDASALAR